MLLRGLALILAGILLVGCSSNEPLSNGFAGAARAAETGRDPSGRDPSKKTLASKMLGAIALERVTGRKTDPSRLTQLN